MYNKNEVTVLKGLGVEIDSLAQFEESVEKFTSMGELLGNFFSEEPIEEFKNLTDIQKYGYIFWLGGVVALSEMHRRIDQTGKEKMDLALETANKTLEEDEVNS